VNTESNNSTQMVELETDQNLLKKYRLKMTLEMKAYQLQMKITNTEKMTPEILVDQVAEETVKAQDVDQRSSAAPEDSTSLVKHKMKITVLLIKGKENLVVRLE
jgi:hypothetical protein